MFDIDIIFAVRTIGLFIITAIAEILGCYFPHLILNQGKSHWLWFPCVLSLSVFVYLLTLHPQASGRVYAMYGGIYICTALLWLHYIDKMPLTCWDIFGGVIVLLGALLIILQPNIS